MRIALFAMPNTSDILETACRLPNLALVSLAGSLKNHEVSVLDLVLEKPMVKQAVYDVLGTQQPQLVGLSAMTFQWDTLLRIAAMIRASHPDIGIVVGGYHATLMYREITEGGTDQPFDYVVRGEGERTFSELADELEKPAPDLRGVDGLSFRAGAGWQHNPPRELADLARLPLPDRGSRVADSFHALGESMDVVETSRGCPHNCNFCCIAHMYGRTFRPFPIDRVVADLKRVKANGAKSVFFIDDNITHSIDHFKSVCNAIIESGLTDMFYMAQVTAAGMAGNPDLVELMRKANFKIVFVGFESMEPEALRLMKKPTSPEINRKAASILRANKIAVIAGAIVGFPEDTRETIRKQMQQVRQLLPDGIYVQYLTPYPKTVLREEMLKAGLVVNKDNFSEYDGFSCVVRTKHLSREELYRAKKLECLRPSAYPKYLWHNRFLRDHFRAFLLHEMKTALMVLRNIVTLKQRECDIDV